MAIVRWLVFVVGLLLLGLEATVGAAAARQGVALAHTARQLQQEFPAGAAALGRLSLGAPDSAALAAAGDHFARGGAAARALSAALERAQPFLFPALRDPSARAELDQVRAALAAADDGSAAATAALQGAQALLSATSASSNPAHLAARLAAAQPAFATAQARLTDVDRELGQVRAGRLLRLLQPALKQEAALVPTAQTALRLAALAPAALGDGQPISYLIVAQNPADLRPTGGFIGSWGVLTLKDGAVASFDYRAYNQWEDVNDPRRFWPEQTAPFQRYRAVCCMAMQDANWFADFPTSALVLEQFAEADQHQPIAGVIAFDPALVQALLQATGPVDLPSLHVTVTAANFVDLANYYEGRGDTQPPPDVLRDKQFLVEVAHALAARLLSGQHLSLPALLPVAQRLLDQKHVLIALDDPDLAAYARAKDWDGALANPPGDYLALADLSLSDNKIDDTIARQINDQVQLTPSGAADVTLAITWQNRFPRPVDPGAKTTDFRDYFRLYLPPGATLTSMAGADENWKPYVESGHPVLSGYLVVPRGGQRTMTVRYHVPAPLVGVSADPAYALHIQVQPGVAAPAFQLTVRQADGDIALHEAALLTGDRAWQVPVRAASVPVVPAPLAEDRRCAALSLVAGLAGPASTGRVAVPASCIVHLTAP